MGEEGGGTGCFWKVSSLRFVDVCWIVLLTGSIFLATSRELRRGFSFWEGEAVDMAGVCFVG